MRARAIYSAIEADARVRWWLRETPSFDPLAAVGPFTTLVAFLPSAFATRLTEVLGTLDGVAAHYRYAPAQLHLTIRNLDGVDLSTLAAPLADCRPLVLRGGRLGFTRETLLQRLSADVALRRLREGLDLLPGARAPSGALRDLAFTNVLRLNGPVRAELLHSVRRHRDALAGEPLELEELALVRTDKVGSPGRTRILARYPLRPAR